MKLIGEYITCLRHKHNMKQEELASKMNVTRSRIGYIEKNVSYPSSENIKKLKFIFPDWDENTANHLLELTKLYVRQPELYDKIQEKENYIIIIKDILCQTQRDKTMKEDIDKFNLIGNYIFYTRTKLKLSIEQLSEELNIVPSKFVKIETSKLIPSENDLFTLKQLIKDEFDISLANYLLKKTKLYIEYPDLYTMFEKLEKENEILRDIVMERENKNK